MECAPKSRAWMSARTVHRHARHLLVLCSVQAACHSISSRSRSVYQWAPHAVLGRLHTFRP
eukprot:1795095-Karenia_brevis.AAC.1